MVEIDPQIQITTMSSVSSEEKSLSGDDKTETQQVDDSKTSPEDERSTKGQPATAKSSFSAFAGFTFNRTKTEAQEEPNVRKT